MRRDGLTSEELQKVIARAIAFDEQKRATYSENEIRYTAAQVGVSNEGLDAALKSMDDEVFRKDAVDRPALIHMMRVPAASGFLAGVCISTLYAVAIAIFDMNGTMQIPNWAMNCVMMASGALSVWSATEGNARRYFARNLGLWFGFGMGVYAVYKTVVFDLFKPGHLPVGVVLSHLLEVPIIALILSTLVGGFMISRQRSNEGSDSGNANGGVAAKVSSIWTGFKKFMNQRIEFLRQACGNMFAEANSTAGQTPHN
jgi:hypothetical protein